MMNYLSALPGLVIGITIHEAAHAISAKWLGDRLAWSQGRVTLNPFKHLSLLGTLALFVLGFGWGKPVEINLYHFKSPKLDYLLCSLAGPLSNLLISMFTLMLLYFPLPEYLISFLVSIFYMNGILALINLIPIPPLDGSKIWPCLIPGMRPVLKGKISLIWFIVLLMGFYTGSIDRIMDPCMSFLSSAVSDALYGPRETWKRPAHFPPYLHEPNEAYNFTYRVYPSHANNPTSYALCFDANHPHPCDNLIAELSEPILLHNWHQTQYNIFDPNQSLSGQWSPLESQGHQYLEWINTWINDKDQWIQLVIYYYIDPNDGTPGDQAEVKIYQGTSEKVIKYRENHPQE